MRHIAAEAGVTQPLLSHHFGSRAKLVEALVDHVIQEYENVRKVKLASVVEMGDAESLIEFLFGGDFNEISATDKGLFLELQAAAVRDESTQAVLSSVYHQFESDITDILSKLHPNSSSSKCEAVAHALVCMAEGFDMFQAANLRQMTEIDIRDCARAMLLSLVK